MKKIIVLLVLSVVVPGWSMQAFAESFSERHQQVVDHFVSKAEPTVKDAIWTKPDIFKVAVFDNGRPRDGYADYVCSVLDDFGFKDQKIWVQVIDMGKLLQKNKWVKLGEAHCR
ncbi:MAG: hypothetical protein AB7E55_16815 [Pigmentiphaga sp.]